MHAVLLGGRRKERAERKSAKLKGERKSEHRCPVNGRWESRQRKNVFPVTAFLFSRSATDIKFSTISFQTAIMPWRSGWRATDMVSDQETGAVSFDLSGSKQDKWFFDLSRPVQGHCFHFQKSRSRLSDHLPSQQRDGRVVFLCWIPMVQPDL